MTFKIGSVLWVGGCWCSLGEVFDIEGDVLVIRGWDPQWGDWWTHLLPSYDLRSATQEEVVEFTRVKAETEANRDIWEQDRRDKLKTYTTSEDSY